MMDVAAAAAKTDTDDVALQVSPRRADGADTLPAAAGENARVGGGSAVADRGAVYPPRSVFRPMPRNITVSPGERAVLKCRVENLGTKTVSARLRSLSHPFFITVIYLQEVSK